jgi:hypothetical protein
MPEGGNVLLSKVYVSATGEDVTWMIAWLSNTGLSMKDRETETVLGYFERLVVCAV